MRTSRFAALCIFIFLLGATGGAAAQTGLQFVPATTPCRLLDTRTGSPLQSNQTLPVQVQGGPCAIPGDAEAYSFNVTVVPRGSLNYLTVWPAGETQPLVSTMNSYDGRVKANAAIIPAGSAGEIDLFATNTTDVILDINGYFTASAGQAFYPLTPCRVKDTRTGDYIHAQTTVNFPVQGICGVPAGAQGFSLNLTAVPRNHHSLNYLTAWPAGQPQPATSTLNAPTGTNTANAAIVQSGTGGQISVFAYDDTDLIIDVNGYFAAPGSPNELVLYTRDQQGNLLTPCRVLDTRPNAFQGVMQVPVQGLACNVPRGGLGYIINATVVPQGSFGYLTLWPDGETQPVVSTLNASDGAVTSNMAIVPTNFGAIQAYNSNTANLIIDFFAYLASPALTIITTSLPDGGTGQPYNAQLVASGGAPPYTWSVASGSLPPNVSLSSDGSITGIPTTSGSYSFVAQVSDSHNMVLTAPFTINISSNPLQIITTRLPSGTVQVPYNATLLAAGGTPPLTWSIVSESLPPGLNLDPSSGTISGTPTTVGASNFTVEVTDSLQQTAPPVALQIAINAATTNGSLAGNYAFSFSGYNTGKPVVMAGTFLADGAGHITSGVLDLNSGSGSLQNGYLFTGIYNITANGMGTMTFTVTGQGTFNFHVAVSSGGNGQMIQDNTDPATRGSGAFFVQTTTDFHVPPPANYAEGTTGSDQAFKRYAKAGVFQVGANGVVNSGTEDLNDNGTPGSRAFTGSFAIPSPASGRGQVSLSYPNGITNNYAYYVVSKGQFIIVGTDPVSAQDPLTLGTILKQASSSFSNASLTGNAVIETSGLAPNGGSPQADIVLGLLQANGNGGATASVDENQGGTLTQQVSQGTYTVQSNGRTTLSGFGSTNSIVYLTNTNSGFVVGQSSAVQSGVLEQQSSPPPFSNLSIFGTYLGGTVSPVLSDAIDSVASFQADGSGNINGIQNDSGPSGIGTQNIVATYQVDSTGRAVLSSSGGEIGILYVVSNKKVVLLPSSNEPVLSTFSLGLTN